jgi:hypothetical protein
MTSVVQKLLDWFRGTRELNRQRAMGHGELVDRLVARCCGDKYRAERCMLAAVHANVKHAEKHPDLSEAERAQWAREQAAIFWFKTLESSDWELPCD